MKATDFKECGKKGRNQEYSLTFSKDTSPTIKKLYQMKESIPV